jgi:hypothetical protein
MNPQTEKEVQAYCQKKISRKRKFTNRINNGAELSGISEAAILVVILIAFGASGGALPAATAATVGVACLGVYGVLKTVSDKLFDNIGKDVKKLQAMDPSDDLGPAPEQAKDAGVQTGHDLNPGGEFAQKAQNNLDSLTELTSEEPSLVERDPGASQKR